MFRVRINLQCSVVYEMKYVCILRGMVIMAMVPFVQAKAT